MRTDEQNQRILTAREQYLETGSEDRLPAVRPEVAASWKRSLIYSIDPSGVRPDYRKVNSDRLSTAALPVIENSLQSLTGTATSLLFGDANGRLIGRWTDHSTLRRALNRSYVEAGFCMSEEVVGANGIGTALETGQVAEFRGAEHFSNQYLSFTCVGAPIRHPISRRIVGAIDITCRLEDTATIARPWITGLAAQIEQQLLDDSSVRERMLLSSYLAISRRTKRPVVCISDRLIISNPGASSLVAELDQLALWEAAQRVCRTSAVGSTSLTLPSGATVMLKCRAVRDEGRLVGAVLELELETVDLSSARLMGPGAGAIPLALPTLAPVGSAASRRTPTVAPPSTVLPGLVGRSERWSSLCTQAHQARTGSGGIIVSGEPGTGKLALLRALFSARNGTNLQVIDCSLETLEGPGPWVSSVREVLATAAEPLVLSHLEALSITAARALCALFDGHPADGRRVLATLTVGDGANEPHQPLVDRIGIGRLVVPALRDRTEDIPDLVGAFSQRHAVNAFPRRWLPETLSVLTRQRWSGNIRELESMVRRTLNGSAGGPIGLGDLPEEIRSSPGPRRTLTRLEQLERQEILDALRVEGGNKVRAAARLKFARSTLYRKMTTFGIEDN